MTEMLNSPVPERICVETCIKGSEMIETTTKEALKDGKWKAVGVLGQVLTPIGGIVDCASVCSPSAIINEGTNLIGAGLEYVFGSTEKARAKAAMAAAKTSCSAMLAIPQIGYASCLSCCAGIKYLGVA